MSIKLYRGKSGKMACESVDVAYKLTFNRILALPVGFKDVINYLFPHI